MAIIRTVVVNAEGPQGAKGDQGPSGSQGPPGSVSSTFPFSGSAVITGSLLISGSNLTVLGSVTSTSFTGSLLGTSSFSINAITASYIDPLFISASAASYGFGNNTPETDPIFTAVSASLVYTSSFNAFTSSIQSQVNNLNTATSSFVNANQTGSFTLTSSFNSFTASYTTGSFLGNINGTASWAENASQAVTASYVSSNFQYEIHVSQVDGNDTTGNGDLLKPVATIGKALLIVSASVASTDRRTIIVHPGTYIENITVNTTNTYFFSTGLLGANCLISGSVTVSAATRMSGLKITNLIVSSSAPVYINNCAVDKQMTVSGSGYLEVQNTSLQCTSGIQVVGPASSGVIFENCLLYPLTVNNASAAVYIISCNQAITPTLTAGALTITRSTISSLTSGATSTALTTAAGSVLVLESCNVYNSLLTSHAAITANGFYSIKNVIYNKPASTLASLSGTGGPLATISQFQYINADNITTSGLTVTGSLNITGSTTQIGNINLTGSLNVSAGITGSLFGTASWAQNATTATTASYINPTFISASAAASGFGSGGGGDTSGLLSTASFNSYTSSVTSQFAGTASFATTALNLLGSVENATNASSGSNFVVTSTLRLDESLIDFGKQVGTGTGIYTLFEQATGSYTSAHGKYTLYKGANARAGEFVTVWNGTSTTYYDNATTDIGTTSDITFQSSIVTSQIQINAVTATSGWTVKMLVTYL